MTTAAVPKLPQTVVVKPHLHLNPYLDVTLRVKRGPDGVELIPTDAICVGQDGYVHFSIIATLGEEAAWWAIGDDHAVPASVSVQLMRPAHIDAGPLIAIGECLRTGSQVIVSEGIVMQAGKIIAKVTAMFVPFVKQPRTLHTYAAHAD
jgi:acyl-coenzyme A thioesterase PaaI-like protein